MAEVKGKFITLAGYLMGTTIKYRDLADKELYDLIGKHWNELDPEGFYDTKFFNTFMETYAKSSPQGEKAIVTLGIYVYPTIKRTVGLPDNLKTTLDYIKFEAQGFLDNHRGAGVKPRKFIKEEVGDVLIEALAPGYNSLLFKGVYLGILQMIGVSGQVEQTKSQEKGDSTSVFSIKWSDKII